MKTGSPSPIRLEDKKAQKLIERIQSMKAEKAQQTLRAKSA